jgi:hypothetical protein
VTASEDRLAPLQALGHSVGTSRFDVALRISHGLHVARVYNSPGDSDADVAENPEIAALLDRGISVVASHKTTDAAVVQDRATFLASFTLQPGQFIADGYYHEPDNDGLDLGEISDWFDLNETFAGITHVTAPDVLWHCTFTGSPGYSDDLIFDFLPPDVDYPWLDFLGVDRYVQNVNNRTPTQAWEAIRDTAITRYGRPLGILEMAVAGTVAQRAQWVADHAAYIAAHTPDVLMSLWFHSDVGENAPLTYDGSHTWAFDHAANAYDPQTPYAWQAFADTYSRYSTDVIPVDVGIDATGATDVTDDLETFLNGLADGTTVEFGTGIFRIDGTVTITDRNALTLTMEPAGYFIRDDPTGTGFLPMFNPVGGCNLTLDGLRIRGANRNAGVNGDYVVAKESQHCVILSGTTNSRIIDCELWEPYGDCVYLDARKIGPAGARASYFWCNTVLVDGCRIHHSGRQLLTLQGVYNATITDCDIWEARRSTFELEPLTAAWNSADGVDIFANRIGVGRFAVITSTGTGPCENVAFHDNLMGRSLLVVGVDGDGGRRNGWSIIGNRFITELDDTTYVAVPDPCAHHGSPSGCQISFTRYDGLVITGNEANLDTGRTPSMVFVQLVDCAAYDVSDNDVLEVVGGDGPTRCNVVGPGTPLRTDEPVEPAPTTTGLVSAPNPSDPSEEILFTATVAPVPDAGTVTFAAFGVPIVGCESVSIDDAGEAVCATTWDDPGAYPVLAAYSGDGLSEGSASTLIFQQVGPVPTEVTVVSSGNPSEPGDQVVYTATVDPTPDGGTVTFTDDGFGVECDAIPVVDGTATCTQTYGAEGSHTIVATYTGDDTFAGSESAPLVQEVAEDVAPPIWVPGSDWLWTIGQAMLSAALDCADCDRSFISDGSYPEQPPPGCDCQLIAVLREGPNAATPNAICGVGRFGEVRLLLDLCVEQAGRDEIPDPVTVSTRSQMNASIRWLMMSGLMSAAATGLLTVLDGPALFGPTWRIVMDSWHQTRSTGGSARWETTWQFFDDT